MIPTKTNIHRILILSALFIFNSCSNEPISNPTDGGDPIGGGPMIEPPTGFEFAVIGDMDNSNPQTQGDNSQPLYSPRTYSGSNQLESPLEITYLPLTNKSSIGLPTMKITCTGPGIGTGDNTNPNGYALSYLDMKPYKGYAWSNLSNYIEGYEPLKYNRIVSQVGMPVEMNITQIKKHQLQIGTYFSSHEHGASFTSEERNGSHGYYFIALPSVNQELGGGRRVWTTIVIDEQPNHFRGEGGNEENVMNEKWPLAVNENRNWLDANNRIYQKIDRLNAFPHPDGNGSTVEYYYSQLAAFHVPNEYGETESRIRNMSATYHEDSQIAWVGFNSDKRISLGSFEARISNTSFHIKGWENTTSEFIGVWKDTGTSAYNQGRIFSNVAATAIGEGDWYFIAVKHSETEKFREIRIPARNNF